MNQMVSVIVTTRNEADVIERLLQSIIHQTYSKKEIILVDNNSSDDTVSIAKRYTKKVFNFGPERSAQRNYGAKKAQGEYLLFLDADMELEDTVLEECVTEMKRRKNIGGVIIPEQSVAKNLWEKVKAYERSFYNDQGDDITDAARFFLRKAYDEAGGYDESITGPEDWDLPETIKKLGFRIIRIKSKIFHYERIKSPLQLARKKYYYALKSHRYLKKQKVPLIGPKTVYFLRPVFWRNWKKLIAHPILSSLMFLMFCFELGGGAAGFIFGKMKKA